MKRALQKVSYVTSTLYPPANAKEDIFMLQATLNILLGEL